MNPWSLAALDGISDYAATAQAENTFHTYHADQPGIVVYSTDGYEGVTTDTFQSSMFDEASYDRTDGQRALQVAAGAPLYKLITSEYWVACHSNRLRSGKAAGGR